MSATDTMKDDPQIRETMERLFAEVNEQLAGQVLGVADRAMLRERVQTMVDERVAGWNRRPLEDRVRLLEALLPVRPWPALWKDAQIMDVKFEATAAPVDGLMVEFYINVRADVRLLPPLDKVKVSFTIGEAL